MRVLVTGAGGFVGAAVCERLHAAGDEVVAATGRADRRARLASATVLDAVEVLPGDLLEVPLPDVDAVVHAAAALSGTPAELERANVALTVRVAGHAAQLGARLVLVSSTSVYGSPEVAVITEDTPPASPDAYGASKRRAEEAASAADAGHVALRLPGVLGVDPTPGPWLVGLVRRAAAGAPVTFHSGDTPFNAAVLVGDVAEVVATALARHEAAGPVNVAAGDPLPVREVVGRVVTHFGARSDVVERPPPSPPALLAVDRLRDVLDTEPRSMDMVLTGYLDMTPYGL